VLCLSTAALIGFWLHSRRGTTQPALAPLKVVPFTSSSGASAPAFSPDGKEIAFLWDGGKGHSAWELTRQEYPDIYVKLIGEGTPLRLTSSPDPKGGPAWSPDGRQITFVRQGARGGIVIVSALGGPEYVLAPLNSPVADFHQWRQEWRQADWSPDGKFLAVADDPPEASPGIFLVSVASSDKQRLTTMPSPGYDIAPTFSPDGKIVAFVRATGINQDIYLVSSTGGAPQRLTYLNKPIGGAFSWTPDGKEILFSSPGEQESHGSLWRVSVTGGAPERLSFGGAEEAWEPALSRQGNLLAYTQVPTNVNIWQLQLSSFHRPMHSPSKLISSTRLQSAPQFSPDGKKIVFASDRLGSTDIWVCNRDGSNPVRLTRMGTVGTPRWSPDGRQIVFDAPASGTFGVYVVSVDGGAPRQVIVDGHTNAVPSWSKDGRWIYFASDRDGSDQIWKIPPHGGQPIQLTRHGGVLGLESLDGKFLYYTDRWEPSGIWRTSPEGGKETLVIKQPINMWYWTVGKDGLYFIDTDTKPRATVKFWSFATRQATTVAALARSAWPHDPALAVSPDGGSLLFHQEDNVNNDIMLVENFR
jgi:Tol biopolymer transport system component